MRAMVIEEFGDADKIQELEVDDPKVGPDSVLIRVRGAGVNPVDYKIREGYLQGAFPHHLPITLGWDVAGIVEAVGPAVTEFEVGMPVWAYARASDVGQGTYAELVSVLESSVALAPTSIDISDAGAVPLAGLTAWQALEDALGLETGESIVIGAAAGGVGHFAVQLAAERGAHVVGVASKKNHQFLLDLGAAAVVDYHDDDAAEQLRAAAPNRHYEAALDLMGGESLELLRSVVRSEGRIASVADTNPAGDRSDMTGRYVFVRPSGEDLEHLASLIDDGTIGIEIAARYPLAQAAEAQRAVETGHTRGKVLLTLPG